MFRSRAVKHSEKGRQRGNFTGPTRHVSQPEEQWHASPQSPAQVTRLQSLFGMWLSVLSCLFFLFYKTKVRVLKKKNPIVFCIFDSVRHRKQRSCNSITKLLESLVLFSPLLGKLFSVHCSMIAGSENPYAVLFYADADRKEGSENQFLRQHRVAL